MVRPFLPHSTRRPSTPTLSGLALNPSVHHHLNPARQASCLTDPRLLTHYPPPSPSSSPSVSKNLTLYASGAGPFFGAWRTALESEGEPMFGYGEVGVRGEEDVRATDGPAASSPDGRGGKKGVVLAFLPESLG